MDSRSGLSNGQRQDWFTPVSNCKYLHFEKLIDDLDTLSITVKCYITPKEAKRYCFKWKHFVAYKNTLEEQHLPWDLDVNESAPASRSAPTYMVANSSWIADLKHNNDYMDMIEPNSLHYVIGSDSYWTEVVSNSEPEIIKLE